MVKTKKQNLLVLDKSKPQIAYMVQYWHCSYQENPHLELADTIPDESGYYFELSQAKNKAAEYKKNICVLEINIYSLQVEWEKDMIYEPGYGWIDNGSWKHIPDTDYKDVPKTYWTRPGAKRSE